jgi:hypothetical protein
MANDRRIAVALKHEVALEATRVSVGKKKLVYVLCAEKRVKYPGGRSRIVYIGTTKRGLRRVAGSVARRADDILQFRGIKRFSARLVTCQPRQRVKTWLVLERALLIDFKRRFGEPPKCNSHGKKMRERDEFDYFRRKRISTIIDDLS